jgi:hypothetical protein
MKILKQCDVGKKKMGGFRVLTSVWSLGSFGILTVYFGLVKLLESAIS